MKTEWSVRCWLFVICLCVVSLILTFGCAPARIRLSPEEARGKFGTIDVKTGQEPAATALTRPITSPGDGAGKGAAMGFVGALKGGVQNGPVGIVIGIAISPLTTVGGAIYGAIAAKDPLEIEQAARVLDRAVTEARLQETLRDSVARRLMARGVDVRDPTSDPPATTVIDTQVSQVKFAGDGINPDFVLVLRGVVTVEQGAPFTWTITGDRRTFLAWSENDAKLFRDQLVRSVEKMAEMMVDQLLSRRP